MLYPLLTVVALINTTSAVSTEANSIKNALQKSALGLKSSSGSSGVSFADFDAQVRNMQK